MPPVNTAPVFADATVVVDVDENETAVYVAQATDAEDTVSYTLGGDDAAAFEIAADGDVPRWLLTMRLTHRYSSGEADDGTTAVVCDAVGDGERC